VVSSLFIGLMGRLEGWRCMLDKKPFDRFG
jgi:hypothetical protein